MSRSILYDCRDCGKGEAGFWHCQDKLKARERFWLWFTAAFLSTAMILLWSATR